MSIMLIVNMIVRTSAKAAVVLFWQFPFGEFDELH